MKSLKFYRKSVHSSVLLILGFLIASIGMATPMDKIFVAMSPVFILVAALIIRYNRRERKKPEIYFLVLLLILLVAFIFEVIATKTNLLFGEFKHSDVLGLMILGAPLISAFTWLIHVMCIGAVLHKNFENTLVKSAISAVLSGFLHSIYEFASVKTGFWTVKKGTIPYQHLLATVLIYFVLFLIYYSFSVRKKNNLLGYSLGWKFHF